MIEELMTEISPIVFHQNHYVGPNLVNFSDWRKEVHRFCRSPNTLKNESSLAEASIQPRTSPDKYPLWSGLVGPDLESFLFLMYRSVRNFSLRNLDYPSRI